MENKEIIDFYFLHLKNGDYVNVHTSIENNPDIDLLHTELNFKSGFHIAAELGHLKIIEYFLERGFDINSKSSLDGYTALMLACKHNKKLIFQYLLDNKADFTIENNKGWTAIMYCIYKGFNDLTSLLIQNGDLFTEKQLLTVQERDHIVESAYKGNLDRVRFYIEEKKIDPDDPMKDIDGANALMRASHQGHFHIVEYLVKKAGARVNYQSIDGSTALMWASRKGRNDIVKFLLENGADPEIEDIEGWTVLFSACRRGNLESVQEIVNYILDINKQDSKFKNTALMYACRYGYLDIVKFLIFKGADFEIPDHLNYTCLMRAVQYGHNTIVDFLLKCGAIHSKKTSTNVNLKKIIQSNNNKEALHLLKRFGFKSY